MIAIIIYIEAVGAKVVDAECFGKLIRILLMLAALECAYAALRYSPAMIDDATTISIRLRSAQWKDELPSCTIFLSTH